MKKIVYLLLIFFYLGSCKKNDRIPYFDEKKRMAENVSGNWRLIEYRYEKHNYLFGSPYESFYEIIENDTLREFKIGSDFNTPSDTTLLSIYKSIVLLEISSTRDLIMTCDLTTHNTNYFNSHVTTTVKSENSDWKEMNGTQMYFNLKGKINGKYCATQNGDTLIMSIYNSYVYNSYESSKMSIIYKFVKYP